MANPKKRLSEKIFIFSTAVLFGLLVLVVTLNMLIRPKVITKTGAAENRSTPKLYLGVGNGIIKTYNLVTKKWGSINVSPGTIWSMKVYNGKLFVGFAEGQVKSYDGSVWKDYGDKGAGIFEMEVYDGKLFIGQGDGYVKSYDGTSWKDHGYQGGGVGSMAKFDNKLYIGLSNGCYKSFDGVSWEQIGCPLSYSLWAMDSLGGKLYLGDGHVDGHTWSYDGIGILPLDNVDTGVRELLSFKNSMYLGGQNGVVFVYKDGKWVSLGDKGAQINAMVTRSDIGKMFIGQNDGVVQSYDGNTWTNLGDAGTTFFAMEIF